MPEWLDPKLLIQTFGLIGVISVIYAESGLFFGFFFPGDSLLFTAGFLASQGYIDLLLLMIGVFVAAVLGDSTGYAFGRKVGPEIFKKEHSFFFNKKNIERAHRFYEERGGQAIILARFMPVIRTFAPIMAGVGKMNYKHFLTYNIIGGAIWSLGLTGLGFVLGNTIPNVDEYLLPIILVIVVVSILPGIFHLMKSHR
jgi:membrane-associated protein